MKEHRAEARRHAGRFTHISRRKPDLITDEHRVRKKIFPGGHAKSVRSNRTPFCREFPAIARLSEYYMPRGRYLQLSTGRSADEPYGSVILRPCRADA